MQLTIGVVLTVVGLLIFFIAILIYANWTGEPSDFLWWTLTLSGLGAAVGLLLIIAADSKTSNQDYRKYPIDKWQPVTTGSFP